MENIPLMDIFTASINEAANASQRTEKPSTLIRPTSQRTGLRRVSCNSNSSLFRGGRSSRVSNASLKSDTDTDRDQVTDEGGRKGESLNVIRSIMARRASSQLSAILTSYSESDRSSGDYNATSGATAMEEHAERNVVDDILSVIDAQSRLNTLGSDKPVGDGYTFDNTSIITASRKALGGAVYLPNIATPQAMSSVKGRAGWRCGRCNYHVLAIDHNGNPIIIHNSAFGETIPLHCSRCKASHTDWTLTSIFDSYGDHANIPARVVSIVRHGAKREVAKEESVYNPHNALFYGEWSNPEGSAARTELSTRQLMARCESFNSGGIKLSSTQNTINNDVCDSTTAGVSIVELGAEVPPFSTIDSALDYLRSKPRYHTRYMSILELKIEMERNKARAASSKELGDLANTTATDTEMMPTTVLMGAKLTRNYSTIPKPPAPPSTSHTKTTSVNLTDVKNIMPLSLKRLANLKPRCPSTNASGVIHRDADNRDKTVNNKFDSSDNANIVKLRSTVSTSDTQQQCASSVQLGSDASNNNNNNNISHDQSLVEAGNWWSYQCALCRRCMLRMDGYGYLVPLDRTIEGDIIPIFCAGCKKEHNMWLAVPQSQDNII